MLGGVEHENATSDFLPTIAPAIMRRIEEIDVIEPGYRNDELCNLELKAVDEMMRPHFQSCRDRGGLHSLAGALPNYDPAAEP